VKGVAAQAEGHGGDGGFAGGSTKWEAFRSEKEEG